MNKALFLAKLRVALISLPAEERDAAVSYYEEYFDEAGPENEQAVIAKLGSPERVAEGILRENAPQFEPTGQEIILPNSSQSYEEPYGHRPPPRRAIPIWLMITLIVIAVPIVIPLIFGGAGVVLGLLGGLFFLVIGFLLSGIGLVVAGIITVVASIWYMITAPLNGLLLLGVGLMAIGGGLLLSLLVSSICKHLLFPLLRWFVRMCKRPFQKGGAQI